MAMFHSTWREVMGWLDRMVMKHGGVVTDVDGHMWDWGQATCRVLYGRDWSDSPEFKRDSDNPPDRPAPKRLMKLIADWENGEWPDCIEKPDSLRCMWE